MKECYKYLYVSNSLYVNSKQNVFALFIALLLKGKPFHFLQRNTRSSIINFFPLIVRIIRVMTFVNDYHKKRKVHYNEIITSDIQGEFLIILRHGVYKIIHINKFEVTTTLPMDLDDSSTLIMDLQKAERAAVCELAPNLICSSIENRYFKEEYINAIRPSYSFNEIELVYKDVIPALIEIINTEVPIVVNSSIYIRDLWKEVDYKIDKLQQKKSIDIKYITKMKNFRNWWYTQLQDDILPTSTVMVFSHGDFWEGNILQSNNGLKVIDWNTASMRSYFFDLYFVLFSLTSRTIDTQYGIYRLNQELSESIDFLSKTLINSNRFEGIPKQVVNTDFYRLLFYLDFMLLKLKEFNTEDIKHMKEFVRWLDLFEELEKCNSVPMTSKEKLTTI